MHTDTLPRTFWAKHDNCNEITMFALTLDDLWSAHFVHTETVSNCSMSIPNEKERKEKKIEKKKRSNWEATEYGNSINLIV